MRISDWSSDVCSSDLLISPGESAFSPVAADPDYNQGQGGYTQKGGDHKQGGGDYNQSQMLSNIRDLVTNIIQPGQVVQPRDIAGGVQRGGGRQVRRRFSLARKSDV